MRLRYLIILTIMASLAFTKAAFGARDFGIGVFIGQPSGIKAAFSLRESLHLNGGAAWALNDWLLVFADCQVEDYIGPWSLHWRWYYGLGAYAGIPETRDGVFGVRIPLGVSYHLPYTSFEIFGEVVPALRLIPDTKARFQGGVGFLIWL